MIKKFLTLLLAFSMGSVVYASGEKYTISVCMTLSLENALVCKKRIFDKMDGKVFIVKDKDERYYTYLDIFDNKDEARRIINSASDYVKKQKPYVKTISEEIIALYTKKKIFIDLNAVVKQNIIQKQNRIQEIYILKDENKDNKEQITTNKEQKQEKIKHNKNEEFELVSINPKIEELKFVESYPFAEGQKLADDNFEKVKEVVKTEEVKQTINPQDEDIIDELKQTSMNEFDKADEVKKDEVNKKTIVPKVKEIVEIKMNNNESETSSILDYDEIIIEIDSVTNSMTVKAKVDNQFKTIKTYMVSTGKKNVKKPFGLGKISKISLNPIWYPTQDTLKSFRKRGIHLPSVVPPGHKYNYMGAAKINLTHVVDGKNTFRIHGTLNENTIGTNESAGCIRMKNNDVVQLVSLLNEFTAFKNLDDVTVILK